MFHIYETVLHECEMSLLPHILFIIFGLEFSLANKNDQNEAWRGWIAIFTAKVSVRPILTAATVKESLADEILHGIWWCGTSCYLRGNIKGHYLCHFSFLTEPPRRMELEEILLDPWLNKVKVTAVLGQKCHWFFKFLLGTIGALFEH